MTIYITVYVILAILVLLLVNMRLVRSRKMSKMQQQNQQTAGEFAQTDRKDEALEARMEQVEEVPHAETAGIEKIEAAETKEVDAVEAEKVDTAKSEEVQETQDLSAQVEELLEDSAIAEPALEYVEANVQPIENLQEQEKAAETETIKQEKHTAPAVDDSGAMKVLVALMLGAFVAILNQTLLNVAIPHIMNDLGVSANTVQWLSTGYMLVNGIMIPVTAYLIEKFGTRKLFLAAVLLFTIGSLICSFSLNFSMLMVGRVVQASGAGIIMPLLMTVFFAIFPPEKRGKAMGIMGIVMIFAPAVGPTLSGWLIGHYSWRLLFDIVIPIGVLDLILSFLWMRDVTKITNPKFDFPGLLFSTLGFGFLLYGFSEAGNDGWSSGTVIASLTVGVISLALFVWRELTTDKPMLDLRVFKYDIFSLTTVVSMIVNMAMFGAMILLPIYMQNIRGYSALQSGLLLLPGAIVMGIMSPVSGALFDKIGARPLAVIGLTITVITTWQFTTLSMTTDYYHIMFLYVFRMFGMSFIMMTVMTEGLNQLPRHLGAHGTAASNTARQVAGSIGTALMVTVMSTRQGVHYGEYMNTFTSSNPYIATKFSQLSQALSGYVHVPAATGRALTTYIMYGQTMQQSTIDGINDAFIFATGIAFVALVLSFFIKRSKVKQ